MDWSQILYLLLLLIGSGAAVCKDRWFVVVVMWFNLGATVALTDNPFLVGIGDLITATLLVRFGDARASVVAALFVPMLVLYRFDEQLGHPLMYSLVDGFAYTQLVVIGGGGFGQLRRNIKFFIRDLFGVAGSATTGGRDYIEKDRGGCSGRSEKSIK